jgi:hypothetical protein
MNTNTLTLTRPRRRKTSGHSKCRPELRGRDAGVRRWHQGLLADETSRHKSLEWGPIARNRLLPGAVVWAHIPYRERPGEKLRPAVVLGVDGRAVCLLPGYSAPSRWRFVGQYLEVTDLEGTGLLRPTGLRRRPVTVDQIEIAGKVGRLSEHDWGRVLQQYEERS